MTDHATQRDPFGDDIVTEPRQIEAAVEPVNAAALDELLRAFGAVEEGPPPRLRSNRSAILVLSPEPGYGKSHLLGRLFRKLDDRATELYLRPFQDPSSCWISILEKTVFELDRPDASGKLVADPGENTQLDTMARRVLMAVMAQLLRDDRLSHPNKQAALATFERFPNGALEMPEWRDWLRTEREALLKALDRLLKEHGVELRPSRRAWLKVLLAYAYADEDEDVRQLCLDWIKYLPLDADEGGALGLRAADLPDAELPYEQRNEKCFERLADLFTIGSYYRPFLLAFDQTELYGSSPALARCLGVVLSRLRRETCNHLVVVTGNTNVWKNRVQAHFEEADAHSLDPRVLELHGMDARQAAELVRRRFDAWEVGDAPDLFCRTWLAQFFSSKTHRSAREVLRRAHRAWSGRDSTTPPDLESLFQSYRRKLLAAPKGLAFDPGVLQWAVEQVLGPAVPVLVQRIVSPKGYLTVEWRDGDAERVLFGFESGDHWKRWEAILREARRYYDDARSRHQKTSTRLFRLPQQKGLSQRIQKLASEAGSAVRIVQLDLEAAASIFAAHDFSADVEQDNHPLDREQVLAFLRAKLAPMTQPIWEARPSTAPPSSTHDARSVLAEVISAVVRAKRFVTLELLRASLPKEHAQASDDALVACAQTVKGLKLHSSPSMTVFQWLQ